MEDRMKLNKLTKEITKEIKEWASGFILLIK